MGVDLSTYRARIGCFRNPGHDGQRCGAEVSYLLVWLIMSQLLLKLAGDVEENPGPRQRKTPKGKKAQESQRSSESDVQETGAYAGNQSFEEHHIGFGKYPRRSSS
ncbi:uncharacterized protein LOC144924398 isoform X1 [Branchiostoma floridae x Branchiostoma belcheri]